MGDIDIINAMQKTRLTTLSHGSGCGCKISKKDLSRILNQFPITRDKNIIVGTATGDDAGVYRIDDKTALVQTVDFFTPIVDDPYDYGQIAAANAISDIYAMGGKPLFALNIIAFPTTKLPLSILEQIIQGGIDKAQEAGIEIIGGHSIDDPEPKYGLCVTGLIKEDKIIRNNQAKPGDTLVLTKPIGTGIIAKAIKSGNASDSDIKDVVKIMASLNKSASEAMIKAGIVAATDVTGFGLLGHLHGMLKDSGAGARLKYSAIPVIPSVWRYVQEGYIPGGTKSNLLSVEGHVVWSQSITDVTKYVLADAQTSGGLLISCPENKKKKLNDFLSQASCLSVAEIGEIVDDNANRIWVE